MDLFESIVSQPFLMPALLLATASVVGHAMIAARRSRSTRKIIECHTGGSVQSAAHSIPAAVARFQSQLHELAVDVDEVLPRQFRLIDRLIVEGDREIERLQRRLAAEQVGSISVSRREPDVVLLEEAEPIENATPVVLRIEKQRLRRAA